VSKITIIDPTLRDGSHAVKHMLTLEQISLYSKAAEAANIPILEVGHGLGIGASSFQIGKSLCTDAEMISTSLAELKNTSLCVFAIPGIATINKDIEPMIDLGVNVFRIGTHCTEADLSRKHIEYITSKNKIAYGNLMMSHMADKELLLQESKKMQDYGVEGVVLMDSAGAYSPDDVKEKIGYLVENLEVKIGFHGHNNLGLAIANSLAAVQVGAKITDGTARGFGAGAGNTQLEVLVAVLEKEGFHTGVDLYKILDAAELVEEHIANNIPVTKSLSIISGLSGVCGAFTKHIENAAKEYNVDSRDICFELGKRHTVAGQEDLIIEVALNLVNSIEKN
jgi:4-hydroxy 2-oxovalerate aldolase